MIRVLLQSLRATIVLTAITGALYPVAVMAVARLAFHEKSLGSRVRNPKGDLIGSSLIGQSFSKPEYLWGRPSAAGNGYDAQASGGTNVSPVGSDTIARIKAERDRLVAANPEARGEPPLLLVTTSASGLDPHLSPEAAAWQFPRIAKARGIEVARLEALLGVMTEGRTLGVLGEPRLDVLEFNLELDRLYPAKG
jgi:K+-transporting ATPase ATPase C chain